MGMSKQLRGPYAGCDCGTHTQLLEPESDPGMCERCNTKNFKGCVWGSEFLFCVHCGNTFEIEPYEVVTKLFMLKVESMKIHCIRCDKDTTMTPNVLVDLAADPPLT